MTVDELYNRITEVSQAPNSVFTDWKDLIKWNGGNEIVYYLKKREDSVYLGIYKRQSAKYFNQKTLTVNDKKYVKSADEFLCFYPNKVMYGKKSLTFKKLSRLSHSHNFSLLTPLMKEIYNIHDSIPLHTYNFNVVKLKEVQNVTIGQYVDNLFGNKLTEHEKTLLTATDVNNIKIFSLIWDKIAVENTRKALINGAYIDLENDRIGNYFYLKEKESEKELLFSLSKKGNTRFFNHIDDFVIHYEDKNSNLYKMILANDVETNKLGRELFKLKYKQFFE